MLEITKQEVENLYIECGLTDGNFAVFKGSSLNHISFEIYHDAEQSKYIGVYVVRVNNSYFKTLNRDEAIQMYCDFIRQNLLYLSYLVINGADNGYVYQIEIDAENDEVLYYRTSVGDYCVTDTSEVNEAFLKELRDKREKGHFYFLPVDLTYIEEHLEKIIRTELEATCKAWD